MRVLLCLPLLASLADAAAPRLEVSPASAPPSYAPSTTAITTALILERFEELDEKLVTLSAEFRQSVLWEESTAIQTVEGSLRYRKKDHLRLEHRLPETQTLVADGESLWIWRRSTNQVIRTNLEEWKGSEPLAQGLMDFGNYSEMLTRYDVKISTVEAAGDDGYRRFTLLLTPKEKKLDFLLSLRLSTKDFFPYEAELRVAEVTVRSVFKEVRFNPELADSLFRFTPPPGADVFVKSSKASHGP